MSLLSNSEQLVIENLQAQLRSKNEDLEKAKRQIFHLQSSAHQQQLPPTSDAYGDMQLSDMGVDHDVSATPRSISMPHSNGAKSHLRFHLDPRNSSQDQDGDEPTPHAVKRQRTMSQQALSSHKMARESSNMSSRSAGPFTRSTSIPFAAFQTASLQTELFEPSNYMLNGSYLTAQNFVSPMQRITEDNQQVSSDPVETGSLSLTSGAFVDPATWLATHDDLSLDNGFFSPFSRAAQQSDSAASNLNVDTSACGSMTSGATYDNTAPMTRQNSRFDNTSVPGGVRMVRMDSQISQDHDACFPESSQQIFDYYDTISFAAKPHSSEDLFAVGSNLASFAGYHCTGTIPEDGLLESSGMERSCSNTSAASAKSTSSLSARAKDTLKQQNHRALNAPLKPKPSADENKTDAASEEKNDGKTAIAKTKYVRPRQPKVFCDLCDEHKEGFRGEHELRRHKDAKHQSLVRKFICVDPNTLGIPANVQVINPLSKCKACKAQKKYGAYYNAAAHLRRTHFKEKPSRSKNKNSSANGGDDDKRGGKGGGDWPSMHELKNWMREVLVQQDEQPPKEEDDAEDEIDNIQPLMSDAEMDSSVSGNSPQSLTSAGMPNIDYRFSGLVTPNHMNPGMPFTDAIPLSSADFTFSSPPNVPLTFNTTPAMCSRMDQMISSPAQVVFGDAQYHFDNLNYQFAA